MTNEFAIALLKQDIQNSKLNISYCHNDVGIEVLELAIKALEDKGYEQGYADGFAECLDLNT